MNSLRYFAMLIGLSAVCLGADKSLSVTDFAGLLATAQVYVSEPSTASHKQEWLACVSKVFPVGATKSEVISVLKAAPSDIRLVEEESATKPRVIVSLRLPKSWWEVRLYLIQDADGKISSYQWFFHHSPEEYYPPQEKSGE